jgi:SPP1 gp7 family putative phage head morphogenesis protein
MQKLIKQIYKKQKAPAFNRQMLKYTADNLLDALKKGYGKTLKDVDYNSRDWNMLVNLEKNVYTFSAAKNYQQLQQMTRLIKDGERIRSFAEFKREATELNIKYNKTFLNTEYNLAVAGSQMASKWASFPDNCMLKYSTAGDGRVRDSHAALDGVTRPRTDSFWDTWYPPNGFNCRCNVLETSVKNPTPVEKIAYPLIPRMFQTNLAKQGLVFPADHPYYAGIDKETIAALVAGLIPDRENYMRNKTYFDELSNEEYPKATKYFNKETGGFYAAHIGHNFDPRYGKTEIASARVLASKGMALLLPKEGNDAGKTPDVKDINTGKTYEIRSPQIITHRSAKHAIEHAASKNADYVLVYYGRKLSEKELQIVYKGFRSGLNFHKQYKQVYYIDDELRVYKK